jgi:glycosyltransferase involved in cell wall biosynthesis
MPRLELAARTIWNHRAYRDLAALFRRERVDVVHVHNTLPLISPAVYAAARRAGAAVVQTLHNYRLLCPAATLYRRDATCELCVGKAFAWPGIRYACYRNDRAATATIATMLMTHKSIGTYRTSIDRYIALTEFAKRKFVEGGLPEARIAVKPNSVASTGPRWRYGIGTRAVRGAPR